MSIKFHVQNCLKNKSFLLTPALILYPVTAWADVGIPMLFVTMPLMLAALIPIIGIEAYIIKKQLRLTSKKAIVSSGVANVVSTLLGIPLAWGTLVILQMVTGGGEAYGLHTFFQKFLAVTWQAPWLIPYESDLTWMIPAAIAVLLIPFFFVSWAVEYYVIKKMNSHSEPKIIKTACLKANGVTYALLMLFHIGIFLYVML